jgi:hypothetical protein
MGKQVTVYLPDDIVEYVQSISEDNESFSKSLQKVIRAGMTVQLKGSNARLFSVLGATVGKISKLYKDNMIVVKEYNNGEKEEN